LGLNEGGNEINKADYFWLAVADIRGFEECFGTGEIAQRFL
jgi:hypothetical protein